MFQAAQFAHKGADSIDVEKLAGAYAFHGAAKAREADDGVVVSRTVELYADEADFPPSPSSASSESSEEDVGVAQ